MENHTNPMNGRSYWRNYFRVSECWLMDFRCRQSTIYSTSCFIHTLNKPHQITISCLTFQLLLFMFQLFALHIIMAFNWITSISTCWHHVQYYTDASPLLPSDKLEINYSLFIIYICVLLLHLDQRNSIHFLRHLRWVN